MKASSFAAHEGFVGDLSRERVLEQVDRLLGGRVPAHEAGVLKGAQARSELGRQCGDLGEDPIQEVASDHRRLAGDPSWGVVEPIEARRKHGADGRRDAVAIGSARQSHASSTTERHSAPLSAR